MVNYKLTYFPTRGNGELPRQILAYSGHPFEDIRVPKDQWPSMKSSAPFGQLPVLEVDGKQLAQSRAIARYLAKEFGINGKDSWEEGQVDALAEQHKDYLNEVRPYFRVKRGFVEGDEEQLFKDVFQPAFKKHYTFFRKALETSGSGFLVGSSLTWVDILFAEHTADLLFADLTIFDEFPEFKEHQKKIHSIDNIKHWIENRPITTM